LATPAALELQPSVEAQGYRSKGASEKQPEQTVTGMARNTADESARYGPLQWPATNTGKGPTERAGSTLQNNLKSRADALNRRFGNSAVENVLPDGSGRVSNAEANQAAGHFHAPGAAQETSSYSLMGRPLSGPDHPALENAATLKVELEIGGSVRANIRERAGTVEVRMTTRDSHAARGLTGEAGGLRSALGNSGLKLQSFEVSYQNDQRQRRPSQQLTADSRSHRRSDDEAEVFSIPGSNQ
jgi:flagellar hook-length control protein FliK